MNMKRTVTANPKTTKITPHSGINMLSDEKSIRAHAFDPLEPITTVKLGEGWARQPIEGEVKISSEKSQRVSRAVKGYFKAAKVCKKSPVTMVKVRLVGVKSAQVTSVVGKAIACAETPSVGDVISVDMKAERNRFLSKGRDEIGSGLRRRIDTDIDTLALAAKSPEEIAKTIMNSIDADAICSRLDRILSPEEE